MKDIRVETEKEQKSVDQAILPRITSSRLVPSCPMFPMCLRLKAASNLTIPTSQVCPIPALLIPHFANKIRIPGGRFRSSPGVVPPHRPASHLDFHSDSDRARELTCVTKDQDNQGDPAPPSPLLHLFFPVPLGLQLRVRYPWSPARTLSAVPPPSYTKPQPELVWEPMGWRDNTRR